jgi:hypothetical protein
MSWKKVADVARFLADKGQKKVGDHSFNKIILNYPYCSHCGLVALKNDISRRAMKEKCVYYDD